jgi:hypothetical protein
MELRRASSISLLFRKQMAMVVMGDLDRAVMDPRQVTMVVRARTAVMGILPVDPMVGMTKVVKGQMEALATMEGRKAALDQEATEARTGTLAQEATEAQTVTPAQEATEDRTKVQALTMGLGSRTQALSHKSTCTRRS